MGTRHMVAVVMDGKHRIAQYGQWDGYPEGQGTTVKSFCEELANGALFDTFKFQLARCRYGSRDEMEEIWKQYADADGWMTSEQAEAFKKSPYAYLSRDTGADILNVVRDWNQEGDILLTDGWDFAADGLFCEWAYVVDMDKRQLEVYSGYFSGETPSNERFAELNNRAKDGYAPVREVAVFTFETLQDMSDDAFAAICHYCADKLRKDNPETVPA